LAEEQSSALEDVEVFLECCRLDFRKRRVFSHMSCPAHSNQSDSYTGRRPYKLYGPLRVCAGPRQLRSDLVREAASQARLKQTCTRNDCDVVVCRYVQKVRSIPHQSERLRHRQVERKLNEPEMMVVARDLSGQVRQFFERQAFRRSRTAT